MYSLTDHSYTYLHTYLLIDSVLIRQSTALCCVLHSPRRRIGLPSQKEWRRTSSCHRERWVDHEIRAAPRGRTDERSVCCHGLYLDRLAAALFRHRLQPS